MKRALISVSDKTNLIDFVSRLVELDYEIISTGGTHKFLSENGINVVSVSDITNFPEILDGRVKTLHPKIHGGILSVRENNKHNEQLSEHDIVPIDMVVVNLYPFEHVINSGGSFSEAIENIDIGGPSMLRSAAKNFKNVTVLCDFNDYERVINELEEYNCVLDKTNFYLSVKAFKHTANYDGLIATFLSKELGEETIFLNYDLVSNLRYGENPHQSACFYKNQSCNYSIANARQLHGKELSYNNILDANASLNLLKEFENPACVAIKHLNPCGVGEGTNIFNAFLKAYESDKLSIFGGIVALNREVSVDVANELSSIFLEIVIAPKFEKEALDILCKKKNLRVLQVSMEDYDCSQRNVVSVNGGLLIQDSDYSKLESYEVVTTNCDYNKSDVEFAWKVCKHVKSNGIVAVKDQMTIGVGVGQTSRVGSCILALESANEKGIDSNIVLASDAFFPFDDAIEIANQYGVKTIIQTGGSVNDEKVINKCNEYGITMLFTGIRNFKH